MKPVEESLLENRRAFVAFARSRLGNPELAEDMVQDSLLKALASSSQPSNEGDTVTWFYRILRRSIIDLYRRTAARKRAMDRFEQELPESPSEGDARILCQCFKHLMPAVPKTYRELLQRIDLEGGDADHVASDLG